ncbi:MAG: class I SAM-dependent methyltransferase [Candidatus Tectomicrobia bacterium]|uniref:Class I SAM-dependent methyltransferase n=1 Tax=Tectimicrobiota bacterium TaxID=2528274 RepID=A0A932MLZ7_UNCTE|nr:class I SAM-dependent methyltransferase [Candidatus Tectomicrobia bacterium]
MVAQLSGVASLTRRARAKFVIECVRRPGRAVARFLVNLSTAVYFLTNGTYHPVEIGGKVRSWRGTSRETEKRWELIRKHLPADSKTAVDLGSAEGYFVFQMAKQGIMAVGVDNFWPVLYACWCKCIVDEPRDAAFVKEDISHDLIRKMPEVDVVLCLSVMHHLMDANGLEWCAELLRLIHAKVKRALFFEVAQSDEYTQRPGWQIPEMGADPQNWAKEFLLKQGFSRIEKLGETLADSHRDQKKTRALFMAIP